MVNVKRNKISRSLLSKGQNRLLKESLKQLLGQGLLQTRPIKKESEEKYHFLRDVLNLKLLETEWSS